MSPISYQSGIGRRDFFCSGGSGEALSLHVEGMAEDGEPIPPPSGFAEVIKDNPDAMTVLVPFPLARTLQRI